MRLSDVNKNLNEAPVGMLKRAATRLKKHTPFSKGARAEAEGADVAQRAANDLAVAFRNWVGRSGLDKNAISADDLRTFFYQEGFGETADEILSKAVKQKTKTEPTIPDAEPEQKKDAPENQESPFTREPGDPAKAGPELKAAYAKHFGESLNTRLDRMLAEDEGDPEAVFNLKEVEKLILAVVSQVSKKKPAELKKKVGREKDGAQNSFSSNDRTTPAFNTDDLDRASELVNSFAKNVEKLLQKEPKLDKTDKKRLSSEIRSIASKLV